MLVRPDNPPNRLSDEGQTIRAEVVDHDELLPEPGSEREIQTLSWIFMNGARAGKLGI